MKVTMQVIATACGVSKNAVSLALRNHPSISESTRERIRKTASELGYQRNPAYGELMSQMLHRGRGEDRSVIGLINANRNPNAFRQHATIPRYVLGCMRKAKLLNYGLDRFWLYEPGMTAKRWLQIFETRGIRGLVIIGMMDDNVIPKKFLPVLEKIPAVVTGVRTRRPALSFACSDHHILALRAFEKAIELGYKRPGLVLDLAIDELVEKRFSAGCQTGQDSIPKSHRVKPFFDLDAAKEDSSCFYRWLEAEKPDVILTLYNVVEIWIRKSGLRVPDDIGLIQLEWRSSESSWSGMDQHNDITGEAALEMLIGMIHRGEMGVPQFPRATLVGPSWVDGQTVRMQGE